MKNKFDTKAAAHDGAGVMIGVLLISTGLIVLFKLEDARYAWGITLIICGLSFFAGMICFGLKTEVKKNNEKFD